MFEVLEHDLCSENPTGYDYISAEEVKALGDDVYRGMISFFERINGVLGRKDAE